MKALLPALTVFAFLGTAPVEAQIPKKTEVPRLIKELREASSSKVRAAAAENLGALGAVRAAYVKDAIEPLLEAVKKDNHSDVRAAAATAIGGIRPDAKRAVPVLTEALMDKAAAVKIAAMNALPAFGVEARPALPMLMELAKEPDKKGTKAEKENNRKISQAAKDAMRLINSSK
jgi:HEAT repeat protein